MGYYDDTTVSVVDKKCCSIRTMMVYGKAISSLVFEVSDYCVNCDIYIWGRYEWRS